MKLNIDGQTFRAKSLALAVSLTAAFSQQAQAAIIYSAPGTLYSENFDSLPTQTTNNAALQPSPYVEGWRDDTTTDLSHVSVPGWYLYHGLMPTGAEIGANGHQRFRIGSGQNTGAFWGFGSDASDPEKALGSIGSNTVQPNNTSMYVALRLTNMTGATLNSFTLAYDGEQWRDGQSPNPETLSFDYSLTATTLNWFDPTAPFTAVPALNYSSPVFADEIAGGTPVNGNNEGRVPDISATISNISWAPGTDLWLRWGDVQIIGGSGGLADDGLGIDTVRFVAVPESGSLTIAGCGALAAFSRRRRYLTTTKVSRQYSVILNGN
jgi:hypothetical protein